MAIGDGYSLNWKSALGVAKETTWGTFQTATAFLEFNSESLDRKLEEKILQGINSQREAFKRILTTETVDGTIEADLNVGSDALVNLLKQAMGGTVSSAQIAATGAYTHTLRVGDMENNKSTSTATGDMKGLTIQARKGDYVFSYQGMKVDSFTIKAESGSPVMVTFSLVGKTATLTTALSTTVTYTDALPMIFHGVTVVKASSIGAITTTATQETYQSFELTVNNNIMKDIRQLGQRTVSHLPQGGLNVSLKFAQRMDTTTAYNVWTSETSTAFGIYLDSNYSVGTSGGSTYSMFIGVPNAKLNYSIPKVGGRDGILTHELSYTCLRENTTTSYAVQMIVNNATTSYE
jgi:hypothetical protein